MTRRQPLRCCGIVAGGLAVTGFAGVAAGQLRVVEWNVSNYSSGRVQAFQTAIYGVNPGNGLSMSPDVIVGQEFLSATGVATFRALLNTAPGSPGDWEAAPFINGPDTDNAFFYRTSKVDFLGVTVIAEGGPSPNHPRDVERYDIRLNGYEADGAIIACYSSHMKSGTGGSDRDRRTLEARRIRDDAENLPPAWNFLLGADLNIRSSFEDAYEELVLSQENNAGRFFDPIASAGSWYQSTTFRFLHTQDPVGAGGMDDRFDQILTSASLIDRNATDYVGDASIPYSRLTWDDPNHSYRSWGNDGTSFDVSLTVNGNTMVGAAIAQALKDAATNAGHLPVLADIQVPSVVDSPVLIDFGQVAVGDPAEELLAVTNAGDVALWSADGIDSLVYTLSASAEVITVPEGEFSDSAGGAGNEHVVTLDTSEPRTVEETITISSNAIDEPERVVIVTAEIISSCPGDIDSDAMVGFNDLLALLAVWGPYEDCPPFVPEDIDENCNVGFGDLLALLAAWGPCP